MLLTTEDPACAVLRAQIVGYEAMVVFYQAQIAAVREQMVALGCNPGPGGSGGT